MNDMVFEPETLTCVSSVEGRGDSVVQMLPARSSETSSIHKSKWRGSANALAARLYQRPRTRAESPPSGAVASVPGVRMTGLSPFLRQTAPPCAGPFCRRSHKPRCGTSKKVAPRRALELAGHEGA